MSTDTTPIAQTEPASPPSATPATPASMPPPAAPTSWRSSLGFDHPVLERFKEEDMVQAPKAALKSLVEAQRFLGGEKIPVPQESWTEADWQQHYDRLGRPKTAGDYGLKRPDGISETLPVDASLEAVLVENMHKAGLGSREAKAIYEGYFKAMDEQWKQAIEQAHTARQKTVEELQGEWGGNFKSRIEGAKLAIQQLAGERFEDLVGLEFSDGTRLGDHPVFLRMADAMRNTMQEHGLMGDAGNAGREFTMSPDDAATEYGRVEARLRKMEKRDPDYEATLNRLDQLGRIAGPERLKNLR